MPNSRIELRRLRGEDDQGTEVEGIVLVEVKAVRIFCRSGLNMLLQHLDHRDQQPLRCHQWRHHIHPY